MRRPKKSLPILKGSAMRQRGAKIMIESAEKRGCIIKTQPKQDKKTTMWFWTYTDPMITS